MRADQVTRAIAAFEENLFARRKIAIRKNKHPVTPRIESRQDRSPRRRTVHVWRRQKRIRCSLAHQGRKSWKMPGRRPRTDQVHGCRIKTDDKYFHSV